MRNSVISFILFFISALPAFAQQQDSVFSTKGWWKGAEQPFSPVVHNDSTITFRIKAREAKEVNLVFDEWDVRRIPMKKTDDEVWCVTIGPVIPRLYQYYFEIDGNKTLDFSNPAVKIGTSIYGNIVEVHGKDAARFDEFQNVGHGEIDILKYVSTPLQKPRKMYVYLPPNYDQTSGKPFPVLYLRHGGGDNESSWVKDGCAANILDNLFSKEKVVPMIVVMTNGLTDGSWSGGSSVEGIDLLEKELFQDVIPLVENHYNASKDKSDRAIAGLSMGGGQAFIIGMRNLDKFSYIGEFSAGIIGDSNLSLENYFHGIQLDPSVINKNLALLWVSCGTKDPRYKGHIDFINDLKKHDINYEFHESEFGHEWEFWRIQLYEFAQRLFDK